jgi:hypothetical protein
MFTPSVHDRGREAPSLARGGYRPTARTLRNAAVGGLCALASSLSLMSVGAIAAHADDPSETPLARNCRWTWS